jgi:hypothetical protein
MFIQVNSIYTKKTRLYIMLINVTGNIVKSNGIPYDFIVFNWFSRIYINKRSQLLFNKIYTYSIEDKLINNYFCLFILKT